MRTLLVSIFLLISCGVASAAELKIGFVNTERLFRDSTMAVKAQKKLEQEFARRDQDIQKMVKQARDIQSSLEKEGLTMAEADKTRKERDLANLTREIQRSQREFREDLNQRKNEEFSAIHEKARKLIQDIADREKFDLILENVVYASPRVDITDRVMKALER
ncbi:MAG: OmpH family outer membrane protein [Gallionellaceae bacterium]|nr:OmpH family outer membrane protein [Gallionellaceae bacterium]